MANDHTQIEKIGILGLGLIGGSLAKAFRKKAGISYITAIDTDKKSGEKALEEGIIDLFALPEDGYQIFDGCDLVILCTPIHIMSGVINQIQNLDIGIITDVGSVKKNIMSDENLPLNFIGGHPMAGAERHGYFCSKENLFENAIYVLCLHENCTVSAHLLQCFQNLIRKIGANPILMDAKEHDNRVAAISHLPHIAASALSLLAANRDDGYLSMLAAGGFRDITRIASSDAALWAGITEEAKTSLLPVLENYISILEQVKTDLEQGEINKIKNFFTQGAFYRDHLPVGSRGALEASVSLTVYLEDRPGSLAEITKILGRHNINIMNIHIRNNRTYEGGQLQLLLSDNQQALQALTLLQEAGYECD